MSQPSSTQPPSTKRKLDAQNDDDVLPATTRRKDEQTTTRLQFSVRMTNDTTLVIRADPSDTVRSVYEKVESISKIRLDDDNLGLIYDGKQLRGEQTLVQCGVGNDATLISADLRAWRLVNEVASLSSDLQNHTCTDTRALISLMRNRNLKVMLQEYVSMLQLDSDFKEAKDAAHLRLFHDSSAAAALVMLYVSSDRIYRDMADASIKSFVRNGRSQVPEQNQCLFARIVLQFCTPLRERKGVEDPLYRLCRSNLADMTRECSELRCNGTKSPLWFKEVFPFVRELGGKLAQRISLSRQSAEDVRDLSAFLLPQRDVIEKTMALLFDGGPIRLPLLDERAKSFPAHRSAEVSPSSCCEEVSALHKIFGDLLHKVGGCMKGMGESASFVRLGLGQYLLILKELHHISRLYYKADKTFGAAMKRGSGALNRLLKKRTVWSDEDKWIFQHKEATSFETRRHLAMLMLRVAAHHGQQSHEMRIDRSQLLSDSFKSISSAQPASLRRGLYVQFKNEQADGLGVVREWFALVCQAMFDPQRALYVACPADRRRFFPNRASEVDPLHLKYFNFSGRVMALALKLKMQVGIALDRVFVKQLAGEDITLEDVRDTDPYLHKSCKQILEMDPEAVDQDVLGLTFAREVEFLGARKVIELRPGGGNIAVNSENRKEYVDVLIRHLFAESINQQIAYFAEGFGEIASSIQLQKSIFQCLTVQDLDKMLYGSDKPICVDDWKAHTKYEGFVQSDDQISWFWEIVASMSEEQKKALLFFWTSVKHLPVGGFKGLASKLYINKSSRNSDSLPTSQTCFSSLFLPSYQSCDHMRERLGIITQEHVACSFGMS